MATLSPSGSPATGPDRRGDRAAGPTPRMRPNKRRWLLIAAAVFLVLASVGFYLISANWPYRLRKIRPLLEDGLASQIQITSYHRIYFPNPGFVATGLTLRRKSALQLPP